MDRFLEKLRDNGNVRASCKAAGVPRRTVYNWRDKWLTFRTEWEDALEDACDVLEAAAWKRAVDDQSDRMLMFLLKAHRPSKYKDRIATELTGAGGGPIAYREVIVEMPGDDSQAMED